MSRAAAELQTHIDALFPICRSITGQGLRQTLGYIADKIPLRIREVPTGTAVLDWEIPPEWNVRHAAIYTLAGDRVVDFSQHNLHLVQYSEPVDRIVSREELDTHLHSLPNQPDLIPYRTAYYRRTWGFCLSHRDRLALTDDAYRVVIVSTLEPGSLSYGECFLPGASSDEVLFSSHCCHPSLANDNLSAISVAIELARGLAGRTRRLSYRFLFMPGTIGAITWLHFNRDAADRVRHGVVLSCLGNSAPLTYKRSRRGDAMIDRYIGRLMQDAGLADRVRPFIPMGYDERQYCSPGFNLPVGCLMRSPPGSFPEYHTSADNPGFLRLQSLTDSLELLERLISILENDAIWVRTNPYGEPQLGRRGLYAQQDNHDPSHCPGFDQETLLWVLNLADGQHSSFDMAELSGKPFMSVVAASAALAEEGLLAPTGLITADASGA